VGGVGRGLEKKGEALNMVLLFFKGKPPATPRPFFKCDGGKE
jgi:hypothetical protein